MSKIETLQAKLKTIESEYKERKDNIVSAKKSLTALKKLTGDDAASPADLKAAKDAVTKADAALDKLLKSGKTTKAAIEREKAAEEKRAEKAAEKEAKAKEREAAKAEKAAAKEAKAKEREEKRAAREAEKAEKAAAKEAAKMPTKNGVTHPKKDSLCGKAWAVMDTVSAELKSPAPIKAVLEHKDAKDLSAGNVRSEYARWRKYHGITGRVTIPAEEGAQAAA